MDVIFYKPNSEDVLISFYSSISNNRIPIIGETVVIEGGWYVVDDIVTSYKKLKHQTYSTVSVILKNV